MATITGKTSAAMDAIAAASVVSGAVVGDNLILTTNGGAQINAGNVRGITGSAGLNGTAGATWLTGSGVPSVGLGANNDLYLNTANGDVYRKTSGVWVVIANIIGPAGGGSGGATDLGYVAATRLLTSSTGADVTIPEAVAGGNSGLMTGADKTAVNNISATINTAITNLIGGAPAALDTLNELAAALNDDANYAATLTTALNGKQNLNSTLTSLSSVSTTAFGRSLLTLANVAALQALTGTGGGGLDTAAGDARYIKLDSAPVTLGFALSDETSQISTGQKVSFRAPFSFKITEIRASLGTSSSTATTIDVNVGGASRLSTKLTIDANETTSVTASTLPVFTDANISSDATITIDVDVVGTAARGLKIWLLGYRTVTNVAPVADGPPDQVVGLTVVPTAEGELSLSWAVPNDNNFAITGYVVEQSPNGLNSWTPIAGSPITSGTTAVVTGLTIGTSYYYRVSATNGYAGGSTGTPSATAAAIAIGTPSSMGTVTATPGDAQVVLTWTGINSTERPVDDYEVEMSLNGSTGWAPAAGGSYSASTGQTVTGLTNGTTYYFRVRAVNSLPTDGAYSAVANATPAALSQPEIIYGGASNATTATLTSPSINMTTLGAQVGDLLVFVPVAMNSTTTTFPALSGWTNRGSTGTGGSNHFPRFCVYTRAVVSGDLSNTALNASVSVASEVNGFAHLFLLRGVTYSSVTFSVPSSYVASTDLIAGLSTAALGLYVYASMTNTVTVPAGTTAQIATLVSTDGACTRSARMLPSTSSGTAKWVSSGTSIIGNPDYGHGRAAIHFTATAA